MIAIVASILSVSKVLLWTLEGDLLSSQSAGVCLCHSRRHRRPNDKGATGVLLSLSISKHISWGGWPFRSFSGELFSMLSQGVAGRVCVMGLARYTTRYSVNGEGKICSCSRTTSRHDCLVTR